MFKNRLATLLILALGTMMIQAGNIKRHPGYIDLSRIKVPEDAFERTDISIDSDLIDDIIPGFNGLASIVIKGFDLEAYDEAKLKKEIRRIEKKLENENWESLVRIKSNDEVVNISMRRDPKTGEKQGIMLVSYEPGNEVTFVNVVGSLPFDQLDNLKINLSDSTVAELKKALGKNKHVHEHDDD